MKKTLKSIISFLWTPVIFFYLKYKGVDTKYGYVNLLGMPIIKKHPNSKIIMHKGVTIVSNTNYNVAGINHPAIIATIAEGAIIELMANSGISGSSLVASKKIVLGEHSGLGVNSNVYDTDFHAIDPISRMNQSSLSDPSIISAPVIIGNHVWVAANCLILKGVKISDNAVVGAGSVVTKDIPTNTIWAGNPARKIKDI